MVEIFPFRGLTYNKEKIKDFSTVITPPNDVISEKKKEELKTKSPYNFVNLILPNKSKDEYQNVAKLFKKWEGENVFVKDNEETIYVYTQDYSANGKKFRRLGFISLIKLEDWGKDVLPHEKVFEEDLKDRIALITATKADFGVPFILYDDREKIIDAIIQKEIDGKEPYIDFLDEEGTKHRMWKICNKEFIDKIRNEMKKYQCIMADGHHRYTSEVRVKDILNIEGAKYGLMCFVNSFNEGIMIVPTNRVVFGFNVDMDGFLEQLREYFEVEEVEDIHKLTEMVSGTRIMIDKTINLKNHVFGVYSKVNKMGYFLKLKDNNVLDNILPKDTDIYKKLDINILHKIIIEKILGITEEQQRNREHIGFVTWNEETIKRLENEDVQFVFFLNPPLMREVFLIARAGETTPQKSTHFYPKVLSGLVVYKMEES